MLMRSIRSPGVLAAAAVLVTLATMGAKGGTPIQTEGEPRPPAAPAWYSGWVMFDVTRSWTKPDPAALVLENYESMFIRRVSAYLSLTPGAGTNPPESVRIASETAGYYLMTRQRVKPVEEIPNLCLGYFMVQTGTAKSTSYSGGASGSNTRWQIPGIGYTVHDGGEPDIIFLGGDCEPGRQPLAVSSKNALQIELGLPGQTPWTFTEGLRWPLNSKTPKWIEGACDSEYYDGQIQCQWKVWPGAPSLVPPRRR